MRLSENKRFLVVIILISTFSVLTSVNAEGRENIVKFDRVFTDIDKEKCKEGEYYWMGIGKGECRSACKPQYDYKNGSCHHKCKGMSEDYYWDSQTGKCLSICVTQPQAEFCNNKKEFTKSGQSTGSYWGKVTSFFKENSLVRMFKNRGVLKGTVKSVEGKVLVERGIDTTTVKVGDSFAPGDTVFVDEGGKLVIVLEGGREITITKKTKFRIPVSEKIQAATSKVTVFFGGIHTKMMGWFNKEKFEIKRDTASPGVRG
ncbi:MAG: hypothetical protein U9P50_00370 [Patescibacteria group bacterium]|nr:hypothetical protein [Patescibacteria group bacterium]